MDDEGSELSPLSCRACRNRKIRCNRKKPSCTRCIDRKLTCHYPQRAKRNGSRSETFKSSLGQTTTTQLNVILDRLLEIERSKTDSLSSSVQSESISSASENYVPWNGPIVRRYRPETPGFEIPTMSFPTFASSKNIGPFRAPSWPPRSRLEMVSAISAPNTVNSLKVALEHVQTLRLQKFSDLSLGETFNLPREVAKSWIESFFEIQPVDMFLGFMNTKLIKLVPDLIDMPDVTLRPVIHVLYFSILHYGSCNPIHYSFLDEHRDVDYPTLFYAVVLRSLSAWQREATGTKMDFAAAILMALVATEHFDLDMAWQMFSLASKYEEQLQLHKIDRDTPQGGGNITDDERRSLWSLIGKDLFCRLHFDRPPLIIDGLSNWCVNLPSLDNARGVGTSWNTPDLIAMTFLVRSRLTFTLNEFFYVMKTGDMQAIVNTTHRICRDLIDVYDGWPINQLLHETVQHEITWWRICEVCLDGYSSILMMLYKTSRIDAQSSPMILSATSVFSTCPIDGSEPLSPLMLDVIRRLLTLVGSCLTVFPVFQTVSLAFGLYRCYLPIASLARHVLTRSTGQDSVEDAKVLDGILAGINHVARNCKDLQPLIVALEDISHAVHQHLKQDNEAQKTSCSRPHTFP